MNAGARKLFEAGIVDRTSCAILRRLVAPSALADVFCTAVQEICRVSELELANQAVGYLERHGSSCLMLAFQHNVNWQSLEQTIEKPIGTESLSLVSRTSNEVRRFPLLLDGEIILGAVELTSKAVGGFTEAQCKLITLLLQDVALVVNHKREIATNNQLAEIAGMSPNEVFLIDAESFKIFQANNIVQEKTGYRPDQLQGKPITRLIRNIDRDAYKARVTPITTGAMASIEFDGFQKRRDGTSYPATFRVQKIVQEGEAFLVQTVVDKSDQKKILDLLQATFNGFPGGIYVLDTNLDLIMANQRLYELLNLPEEEFQAGCNFADIALFNAKRGDYGPGDPQALAKERIDHAKLFLEHSFERTMEDGTVLEIRSSPLAAGGSVVTYMDVTVRHRAEEELTRHRDLLEEAVQQRTKELEEKSNQLSEALRHERQVNELQQQFVSMASHEFRTPLAIIDGAAQRLQRRKGADPDYIADKAQQVRLAVGRMLELMDSILAFGKLESGKISIQIGDCAIGDVLVECCRRQQEISKDHQIQLKTDELPETIQADRSAIEQIVTNLLSNAVKYSPDKSEITVSGYREGDNIVVSVRDSGLGIDAEDIPKMFERYFRARTSSGIAGTGIGLNLVKQLCELHGGSIRVESVKGEGSEFTVTLPVNAKASGVQAA